MSDDSTPGEILSTVAAIMSGTLEEMWGTEVDIVVVAVRRDNGVVESVTSFEPTEHRDFMNFFMQQQKTSAYTINRHDLSKETKQ